MTTFADLLQRIHEEVPAIERLRFVTSYPRDFGDDILEVMAASSRICPYLHVPLQSGSDRMLKFFKRPKRRVPAHLKTWNGAALDALIKLVRDDGVELFVYKAPIRPDPHFFLHDRGSYDAYHVELQARVEALGGHWLDIEGLVPMDLWGVGIVGLPDVFHFREIGHQLLGAAIDAWLAEKLVAVVPPRVER